MASTTLFVTRKFPPSTGGMETMAASLHAALAAMPDQRVRLFKWGGSNKALPVVYPWLLLRTLAHVAFRRPDVVYLQDGVLAPFAAAIRVLSRRVPIVITIHGLEVTYKNPVYRAIVPRNIARCDLAVAVSRETERVLQEAVPAATTAVINNGVDDVFHSDAGRDALLDTIAAGTGIPTGDLAGRRILVTTGRLVERKGARWFVDNVMPALAKEAPKVLYAIAGAGPDRDAIAAAIDAHGLADHVRLLGRVDDATRDALYNVADAFVMPNVDVPGDMEGFGLVALEASSCGTPAVASRLGGISDAVTPGKNGVLVEPGDADAYVAELSKILAGKGGFDRAKVREFVVSTSLWGAAAQRYADAFSAAAAARR